MFNILAILDSKKSLNLWTPNLRSTSVLAEIEI